MSPVYTPDLIEYNGAYEVEGNGNHQTRKRVMTNEIKIASDIISKVYSAKLFGGTHERIRLVRLFINNVTGVDRSKVTRHAARFAMTRERIIAGRLQG